MLHSCNSVTPAATVAACAHLLLTDPDVALEATKCSCVSLLIVVVAVSGKVAAGAQKFDEDRDLARWPQGRVEHSEACLLEPLELGDEHREVRINS